ncbi:MAG: FAD-dependent oxidoreductase [Pseudomonadota bacterium]
MSEITSTPLIEFDVVIVGAGIAGLTCAFELQQRNMKVCVLEKSRGAGGRLASRRIVNEKIFPNQAFGRHPLGTQYIALENELEIPEHEYPSWWNKAIEIKALSGAIFQNHALNATTQQALRFIQYEVCRQLADSVQLQTQQRAIAMSRKEDGWTIETDQQQSYYCKYLVLTIPGPQAITLLQTEPNIACLERVNSIYKPQWTVVCAVRDLKYSINFASLDWIRVKDSSHPLSHAYRVLDTSDQTIADGIKLWTLYATPEWTQNNLDLSPEIAVQKLMEAWFELGLSTTEVLYSQAHRWLYARASDTTSKELFVEYTQLWVGGDAIAGDGIIQSIRSGLAMANAIPT